MTKKFKVGQKVILNCKSFVPKNTLDDDGWFSVEGTITGFTEKRIKTQSRDTEGLYKPENVKELNKKGG